MKLLKSSGKPKKHNFLVFRRVVGKSMLPALRPDKVVVASSLFRKLSPDHVVLVRHEGLDKIKRIEKISGDKVFVVGDNIRASLDSRNFGWLPRSSVVAKVVWPRC